MKGQDSARAVAYGDTHDDVRNDPGVVMIWAVDDPALGGKRMPDIDVLVWEQVSDRPSRCHEGLLQIYLDGKWVTFGRLLHQAATWAEMERYLLAYPLGTKRVVIVPSTKAISR